MLIDYFNAAMRRAEYEDLGDEGWYAHVPDLTGLWANGATRAEAEHELRNALEDWILLGLLNGYPIQPLDGIELLAAQKNVA